MMNFKNISAAFKAHSAFAYLLLLLFVASCAQVVAPGGGPKDSKPPRILKYTPDSAQLNFSSDKVVMEFNEYVQLKDLNNQLIISPPLAKTPDIKIKNKTLTIDLSGQKLKPNTTYSISFGNALQDLNEGNAIPDFKYIFSTGSYIDSLTVSGKVRTAFDHKTDKNILVMLYSESGDSIVYKQQPDYFAKTNTDGIFKISNVRPGTYKIFALKDEDNNYKYGGTESIGFVEGTINAADKKNILIDMFDETPAKFIVKKYIHAEYGKVILLFNRGSDSVSVKNLDPAFKPADQELQRYSENKDTLIYWVKNYDKDSLKLQVSNGSRIIDTLEFKLIKKEDALKLKRNPLKLKVSNNFNGFQTIDVNSTTSLVFSQPIAKIDENKLPVFKQDTVPVRGIGYYQEPFFGTDRISLTYWDSTSKAEDPNHPGHTIIAPTKDVSVPLKPDTKYRLFILPGTFTDIFGLTNDSIKIDFKTQEEKYYGTIKLKVSISDTSHTAKKAAGNYIVQLMDDKENIVREEYIKGTETMNFEYLHPQKYKLKIIVDDNNNGKWDSGNYLKKIQPENVIYDPEEINVRSNWDLDLDWKIAQ